MVVCDVYFVIVRGVVVVSVVFFSIDDEGDRIVEFEFN